jgi:hypothetical protein
MKFMAVLLAAVFATAVTVFTWFYQAAQAGPPLWFTWLFNAMWMTPVVAAMALIARGLYLVGRAAADLLRMQRMN